MPLSPLPSCAVSEPSLVHDDGAVRNDAVFEIPPQRDEQPARHCHDADLSRPRPASREACLPPLRQRTLRLIPHPHPCDLHGEAADPPTTCFADATIEVKAAALVWQGHETGERPHLPPVPELAPGEMLGDKDPRRVLADAAQRDETSDLRGHRISCALNGLVTSSAGTNRHE